MQLLKLNFIKFFNWIKLDNEIYKIYKINKLFKNYIII